jgi:hypothetical protein
VRPLRVMIKVHGSRLVLLVERYEAFDCVNHYIEEAVEGATHGRCRQVNHATHRGRELLEINDEV